MLKLHTDTSFFTETHRTHVFPLLFDLHYVKSEVLLQYYAIEADVLKADIVVFPIDYSAFLKFRKAFTALVSKAKEFNKPIWLYTAGDFGFTIHIPNAYTFRFGGFHSKLNSQTFVLPAFINDPYHTVLKKEFITVSKEDKPGIGFVGQAKSSVLSYGKAYLSHLKLKIKFILKRSYFDRQKFYPSSNIRYSYLQKLQKGTDLETDFRLRDNYRAGATSEEDKLKTSQEFYSNIFNNIYTLCIRGVGNFSVRFYETLAVGRIPILINTDCRLPLEDNINWEDHAVIWDTSNKHSLVECILNYHDSKSNKELLAIQKSNRELWETHLRRHSYFAKVHEMFNNKTVHA